MQKRSNLEFMQLSPDATATLGSNITLLCELFINQSYELVTLLHEKENKYIMAFEPRRGCDTWAQHHRRSEHRTMKLRSEAV